ncbi:glycolate oxidase FAD binding subunit [Tropicibacter naphthalenivorans]|uniref:Putative FAD-linked oxidoreductase n=2 Tax=Tropicibacter naphthalenivorans TaxID=441103 RepID=A0A0P1GD14_9RHOB|nr:putative FAD-linked oxidoreductase [Tropicibacter naphthalenivorans]SMC71427.1 glycolate oxidase FAD binding subunit [Tropicibacter naphthalenivorans]
MAEAVAGATGPLAVRGGGTRGLLAEGAVLETGGLSGITLYEPGALTLVAQAGTPVAQIEAALEAEGQMLAFEPMDHRGVLGSVGEPTIGGVVAANVSGPRRVAPSGACRDCLLGVRFVDGLGQVIKNGGRVMKNVTGYDLVKLQAGAYGTLGVLTEVSLRVAPKPEASVTLVLEGLSLGDAVAAMSRGLTSPYQVTGAAHFGERTLLRIEGFEGSVRYRAGQLSAMFDGARIEEDAAGLWAQVRDVSGFAGHDAVWRISTVPGRALEMVQGLDVDVMLDWGGGLIWVAARGDVAGLHGTLQQRAARLGGHATLVKTPDPALPRFQPEPAPVARLTQGIRAKFDPRGILNLGIMG